MTLGDVIKKYRKDNDLSMDKFSDRSGISKAYISLLEKNKHPKTGKPITPSIQCIKQAANGMNLDFDELFNMIDCEVSLDNGESSNHKLTTNNSALKKGINSISSQSPGFSYADSVFIAMMQATLKDMLKEKEMDEFNQKLKERLPKDFGMPKTSTLAAHFEGEDFTEDEQKEIAQFIDYVKSKRN